MKMIARFSQAEVLHRLGQEDTGRLELQLAYAQGDSGLEKFLLVMGPGEPEKYHEDHAGFNCTCAGCGHVWHEPGRPFNGFNCPDCTGRFIKAEPVCTKKNDRKPVE